MRFKVQRSPFKVEGKEQFEVQDRCRCLVSDVRCRDKERFRVSGFRCQEERSGN